MSRLLNGVRDAKKATQRLLHPQPGTLAYQLNEDTKLQASSVIIPSNDVVSSTDKSFAQASLQLKKLTKRQS